MVGYGSAAGQSLHMLVWRQIMRRRVSIFTATSTNPLASRTSRIVPYHYLQTARLPGIRHVPQIESSHDCATHAMARRALVGQAAALGTKHPLPPFSNTIRFRLSSVSAHQQRAQSALGTPPVSRSFFLALGVRQPAPLASARRGFATSNVRKDEQKPDFKGQLWESTTARVQKERAEQERYARGRMQRAGSSGGALSLGFTIGKNRTRMTEFNDGRTLIRACSSIDGFRLHLLPWNTLQCRTIYRLHPSTLLSYSSTTRHESDNSPGSMDGPEEYRWRGTHFNVKR